jgi:hypothetical protein
MENNWQYGVNRYDSDGDVIEEGIFFFWGDTSVKVAEGVADLRALMTLINANIIFIEQECQRVGL